MSNSDSEQTKYWIALLTENYVPNSVAKQATEGLKHSNWGTRSAYIFVVVMACLMTSLSTLIVVLSGRPCEGDFALNAGIALLLAIFASIPAAALAVGYAQKHAPLTVRKSAFVGAFTNAKNLPYARALAKRVTERAAFATDFETFEAEFSYALLPWFLWPTLVLCGCTLAAYLFLPEICI